MSTPSLERRLDALEGRRESLEKVSAFRAWVADGGRAEDFEKEWPKLRDEGRRAASLLPGLRGSLLSASRCARPPASRRAPPQSRRSFGESVPVQG
jgi:hypothetical protein